ncbi:uncharacterized protein LOC135375914 [Ornithodoros turicata]|uniref:uncharacterized protein LOC135375914 n=1 Tax=Ornithodoros turicata TaxID=34597 RepID=UPI00313A268C
MSYPIISPAHYSFKQMGLIATARSEPGIHIVYQNGFKHHHKADTGEVVIPKGMSKSVKFTHVFYFPDDSTSKEYRMYYKDTVSKSRMAYIVDGPVVKRSLGVYEHVTNYSDEYINLDYSNLKQEDFKHGVSVIQMDANEKNEFMVQWNGQDIWTRRGSLKTLSLGQFVYHQFGAVADGTYFNATLMEIHITYTGGDSGAVFDHTADFMAFGYWAYYTELMLSAGAYLTFEGKVETDAEVTVKDGYSVRFSHTGKTDYLCIIMKIMEGRTLTGEAGKPPTKVAYTSYNMGTSGTPGTSYINVSKSFRLTNCCAITGFYGAP